MKVFSCNKVKQAHMCSALGHHRSVGQASVGYVLQSSFLLWLSSSANYGSEAVNCFVRVDENKEMFEFLKFSYCVKKNFVIEN